MSRNYPGCLFPYLSLGMARLEGIEITRLWLRKPDFQSLRVSIGWWWVSLYIGKITREGSMVAVSGSRKKGTCRQAGPSRKGLSDRPMARYPMTVVPTMARNPHRMVRPWARMARMNHRGTRNKEEQDTHEQ